MLLLTARYHVTCLPQHGSFVVHLLAAEEMLPVRSRANDRGRINQQGRYTALDFGVRHAEHALVVVVLKWLQNGNRMTMDTHASHGRDALGSGIFRGHW